MARSPPHPTQCTHTPATRSEVLDWHSLSKACDHGYKDVSGASFRHLRKAIFTNSKGTHIWCRDDRDAVMVSGNVILLRHKRHKRASNSIHSHTSFPHSIVPIALTSMVHALELEEIRWRIGHFLSSRDLLVCSQVSRSWSNTFWSLHWRHVTLDCTWRNSRIPSVHLLTQHASLIRSLTFKASLPTGYMFFLNSNQVGPLISLTLLNGRFNRRHDYVKFVAQLVTQASPTLQELCIREMFHVSKDQLRHLFMGHSCDNDDSSSGNGSSSRPSNIPIDSCWGYSMAYCCYHCHWKHRRCHRRGP